VADPHSVTTWIALLRQGDAAAAPPLWERYFARLVAFARKQAAGWSAVSGEDNDPDGTAVRA
jgi:hypothetical protein